MKQMPDDELALSHYGLRLTTLALFLKGEIDICASTGATSMTPGETAASHNEIAKGLQARAEKTLARNPKLRGPDVWVVYDPYDDDEGWLMVGPRAKIVAESIEVYNWMFCHDS